ncbi:MAG: Gfo/Idh/MocA family oxidoreductase [Kiritimatiellae bacterium]|nr:Gfo/Idh/MocA family oxidoreductase [Kiritimatiellia bacterium]
MNRRVFIKTGSGAFAIAAAGKAIGADAASNRVRLAIVGCHEKGRGQSVMKSAMKVPGVEIAYVCDVDSRARDWAADCVEKISGYRPKKEKDLRKVLEDKELDGIISETPDHWHAYSAVLAMEAGKAVYVEKPCAFCPREGEIIVDVWRRTGAVFQMGNQRRASPAYQAAMEFLKQEKPVGELRWAKCWYMSNRGSIGRGRSVAVPEWLDWDLWQGPAPRVQFRDNLVHYNWHWFRDWGTAETGNNAPHFADVARWALGVDYPESVECSGGLLFPRKDDDFDWPDVFNMSYRYPGNKFVSFELSCHAEGRPNMGLPSGSIVYGDHGSVLFTPQDTVKLLDEKGRNVREWTRKSVTNTGSLTDPTNSLDVIHLGKYVECIRSRSQATNAPADEAVKSTFMPLLANIAIDTGEAVRLDPSTGKVVSKKAAAHWAREYAKGWDLERFASRA